jgi:putative flippase GtrA
VLVGLLVLYVLVELCGLDPLLAQAIATPLTVIASYLMHRAFSLRQPRVGDHDTLSNH